jgi:hypothetical protein
MIDPNIKVFKILKKLNTINQKYTREKKRTCGSFTVIAFTGVERRYAEEALSMYCI